MKRKAQSEIITTILLILIVLAAVVVVWMVISRFLNTGENAACSKVQIRVISATTAGVTVNRLAGASDVNVVGMRVLINDVPQDIAGVLGELGTVTYNYGAAAPASARIQVAPRIMNDQGTAVNCNIVGATLVPA